MICPNCFNSVTSNEKFCSKCGTNLLNNNIQKPKVPFKDKLKSFYNKYKKICIVSVIVILIAIIGYILYITLFGFEKLSWNNKYEDYKLEYISPSKVTLGVNFSNNEKQNDIKYSSTCGKVEDKGLEVIWDLTDSLGKCKITASYKMKKINKIITVITSNSEEKDLSFDYKVDLESDDDLDFDSLTNKQEKEYGTNPELADTDMDGLYDNDEINTYKTNPIKKDTDKDGLNDYDEIELGLDPIKEDSKGDGLKDGKRELTYNYESDNLKVVVTGTGNIATTIAQIDEDTKISGKKGLIDKLYTFHTDGKMSEATVTISYTDEELIEAGLTEDNLSLYYYDAEEQEYEKIDTIIDKENNTLTATLKHFSHYVVGDTTLVSEESINEILFVLDNSWSMYSNEQYKEITGEEYVGGLFDSSDLPGYDKDGVRFTVTSDLIDKLDGDRYKIGLSEFRRDYANALPIGSKKKELKKSLNNMNGKFITNTAGTNITNALESGMNEFKDENGGKYIVLLTDGQDSSLSYNSKRLIKEAEEKDVKICAIGFGDATYNVELANISIGTGCKFFSSSDVTGLTELFDNINTELNDDLIDMDGDNKVDGILLADSGFIVNRDGFSFGNYGTNYSSGGHCFGMATVAQLYYTKTLPMEMEVINPDLDRLSNGNPVWALTLYVFGATNDKSSNKYNLNNTYFKNYGSLYDFKLKSNVLKYTFGYEYFNEEEPKDIYAVKNNKLVYKSEYIKDAKKIYDINEAESGISAKKQKEKYGATYEKYEELLLNEDKIQTSNVISNDETQILNAIYAGFIKQHMQPQFTSSTNLIVSLRNYMGTEDSYFVGGNIFINILKNRLNAKDVPVISSTYSGGLHAINAISLAQDIADPNHYYIGVYDNNYPGEKRYVDVKCNAVSCTTAANDYYDGSGEPIRFTPSLEYDLQYYKEN